MIRGLIYRAINRLNGKIYIGMTINSLSKRKAQHYNKSLSSKYHFHLALNKYKRNDFIWEIIDTSNNYDDLREKEVAWIYHYNSFEAGYNMTIGGEGRIGYIASKETKEKLSKAALGRRHSNESKQKISEAARDRVLSNESKKKISRSASGRIHTVETKIKLAKANIGENNPKAKLTECDVREIRRLYSLKKCAQIKLAEKYSVSRSCIQSIVLKRTWRDLD